MKFLFGLIFILLFSLTTFADVDGVTPCPAEVVIPMGNIKQLVQVTKKSKYLLQREQKLRLNRERIKKLIKKKNIIGLELIVAGPMDDRAASRWGHAMIRFIDDDGDWRNDYVVSFVLDQNEKDMSIGKAIFGGYPVIPETKTLGEFWGHYAVGEGRSLERIILSADKKQIKKLLAVLQDRADHPEKLGSYTFASNNCANVLEKVLKTAGFPQYSTTRFPTHLKGWAHRSMLSMYPSITINPPKVTLNKVAKKLGISYQQLKNGEGIPLDAVKRLETLTPKEKYILLYNVDLLPDDIVDTFSDELQDNDMTIDHIYGFDKIPSSMYSLCKDQKCVQQNEKFAQQFWPKEKMNEVREQRLQIYFDATYTEVAGAGILGNTTTDGKIPGIDHPWFDIAQWRKTSYRSKWIKKNPKFLRNLERYIMADPGAKKRLGLNN